MTERYYPTQHNKELQMPRKTAIQTTAVTFQEFTTRMGEDELPEDMTTEQKEVRKDVERILRTVQGLRKALDERQDEYEQLQEHVEKVRGGIHFQDIISGRLSFRVFGK